ncbi:hypothetical protein Cyrtocomes_00685 [Candidatus Cyrtobacter comes]|uniref:Sel1 repeat family protein n=1 Tax=Candidatus Cyrtobacter comes TaxID=675776 RepID=A0ABU5L858_9RICK|nr:hypothetical protein [Candidatus Cyrtobacter comes]MDZ5762306.1 hypothetical protein [Candidatus Cyrtobacter comes]
MSTLPRKDFAKAFYWAQKAAEENEPFILSIMYYRGVRTEHGKPHLWLKRAAALGHKTAIRMLEISKYAH